jgi:hypothetical protein
MSNSAPPPTAPGRHLVEALVLAAAFALAHTQSPLYYSNQNQYLLHGAALAHYGHLERDWLANTRDPTPLFSLLVAGAYSVHPWLLQPAHFVLLVGYFLAARWLVAAVPGFPNTRPARIGFAALFTAAHAAILRWGSVQLTGTDYPWFLQAGLAAQYMLGPGLQPSAFGVLLLVALAAFAHRRPVLACALAAGTCWFHSTYLLPAALLVFGFVVESLQKNHWRRALGNALVALVVVAPVVAFTVWRFDTFSTDATRAAHILAQIRIPHHCVPARWFDLVAGTQLVWSALGLFLLRRTAFGRALVWATALAVALTALQLATDSDALALLFPWRISTLLVPVATITIIAKILSWVQPGRGVGWVAAGSLIALGGGGVIVTACDLGYQMVDEHEIAEYIRATARPGDVYLLPVQFPAVGAGHGAVSNTFAPAPRAKPGTDQIPVDLQRFRLMTGACTYVDFKSVPYAPAEVVEWNRRMEFASALTTKGTWDAPGRHQQLKDEGITHVVSPRSRPLAVSYLIEEHRDEGYIVYRVK